MAISNKPMDQWTLDDYVEYYGGSNRLFGNSSEFEAIKSLASELQEIDAARITNDMVYDRVHKLEELMGATFAYVNSHPDPSTSSGIERRDVASSFMKFCQKEKTYMDLKSNVKFFEGKTLDEMRQGVNFNDIAMLQDELDELTELPMNEDNVIKYTNTLSRMVQASEVFLQFQPKAVMFHPVKERATVQELFDKYNPCMDSIRDLRTIRSLIAEGKSWDDLLSLRTASTVLEGKAEVVGANVSRRMKISYNGKSGFFTEESYGEAYQKSIERYTQEHFETPEDLLIAKNKDLLKKLGDLPKKYSSAADMYDYVCRAWDSMGDSKQKDNLQELLLAEYGNGKIRDALRQYRELFNSTLSASEKSDAKKQDKIFRETIAGMTSLSEKEKSLFLKNTEVMCRLADDQPMEQIYGSNGMGPAIAALKQEAWHEILKTNGKTAKGKEKIQDLKALTDNPKALVKAANLWRGAVGIAVGASNVNFNEKDGSELTSRNVATSRMAELLGVGDLIAHSEKMTVVVNGKELHGSFMEFAEGLDLVGTEDIHQLRHAGEVNRDIGGAVARDGSNLKLFDLICGQVDRHAGNFFTKVGEIGEDGKRKITGMMGIDNDLAFSRSTDQDKHNRSGELEYQVFVDRDFSERISGLTREKVEYAVGDILNSVEIDAIMTRVERIKTHIKENAILLSGDEWNLGTTNQDLEKYGKKYLDTLKVINKSSESSYDWEIEKHDEAKVFSGLRSAAKRYEKQIKAEEELLGSVSSMFETAEREERKADIERHMPAKKSEDEMRARRSAIFDKLVGERSNQSGIQAARAEEKTSREPEKMSLKELAGMERASDRGIKFGAAREKAAKMKELESSFTEITKEDIEKANRNMKKPIIGGHRGPKK